MISRFFVDFTKRYPKTQYVNFRTLQKPLNA